VTANLQLKSHGTVQKGSYRGQEYYVNRETWPRWVEVELLCPLDAGMRIQWAMREVRVGCLEVECPAITE